MTEHLDAALLSNLTIENLMGEILSLRFTDLDADEAACTNLLRLSNETNDTYGIAYAYAYLGDCFIGKGEGTIALTNLLQAKELCEKHHYPQLLENVYNWLGLYHEMQNDRLTAMQYFLDALDIAEQLDDVFKQSILLNNVATQFQSSGNYKLAKEYYIEAFHRFKQLDSFQVTDPHYAQLSANIISVCCFLKEPDTAYHYYELLSNSKQSAENQNQIYLCELLMSIAFKGIEDTRICIDKLLIELNEQPKNTGQFFATFLVVVESMIKLHEINYTRKVLEILDHLCEKDEYGNQLKVQYMWVKFYEKFGSVEEKY